jgi:hypothetical protein
MIYVFGDSHVSIFTGEDKDIRIHGKGRPWVESTLGDFKIRRIGTHTAYNLRNKEYLFKHIEEHIPKGAKIILSFGEIDCRRFLVRHRNVVEAVNRYFNFIDNIKNYDLILYLPPPSGTGTNEVVGTQQERNKITKQFNKLCITECKKRRLKYINVFPYLIDKKMRSKAKYYYDTTHLNQRAWPYIQKQIQAWHTEN